MKDTTRLKSLLDDTHEWPAPYKFKFIVPAEKTEQLGELLHDHDIEHRPSRTGKYTSVTATRVFHGSDQIIEVYQRISVVEGLISL